MSGASPRSAPGIGLPMVASMAPHNCWASQSQQLAMASRTRGDEDKPCLLMRLYSFLNFEVNLSSSIV